MNKEVIYLEPEDDITDILTKLQQAEQKLVALVPPKKATMLRSAVNMKLVAKAAKECEKVAVIVTADPAVVKLAMQAQIPVAKTLQSRPVVPTKEMIESAESEEQIIDEDLTAVSGAELAELKAAQGKNAEKDTKKGPEGAKSVAEQADKKGAGVVELSEEGLEKDAKKGAKKASKGDGSEKGLKSLLLGKYRKVAILGGVGAILVVVFLVWALVFAPSANIVVAMSTSASSFNEEVKFVTEADAQNLEEGVFYAERVEHRQKFEATFTATGSEDRGEKAKGSVTIRYTFVPNNNRNGVSVSVPKGTALSANNGLKYVTTEAAKFEWDGSTMVGVCSGSNITNLNSNCVMSQEVSVEAANSGPTYDTTTSASWSLANPVSGVSVVSKTAVSGGTTKSVTVVTQADVNKALEERTATFDANGKEALMALIGDDVIVINSSFKSEAGERVVDPAVGAEAEGEVKLTDETVYSIYVVSRSAVEEYIRSRVEPGDDQRIYSVGEPYFERFTTVEEAARLKSTVEIGPTVTEEQILEVVKGKKIGVATELIKKQFNGVKSVNITAPYFWVTTVPDQADRVKVELTVEENS